MMLGSGPQKSPWCVTFCYYETIASYQHPFSQTLTSIYVLTRKIDKKSYFQNTRWLMRHGKNLIENNKIYFDEMDTTLDTIILWTYIFHKKFPTKVEYSTPLEISRIKKIEKKLKNPFWLCCFPKFICKIQLPPKSQLFRIF